MARKKHLINVHTSTGTTAPTGASLYLGEIAVQHTTNDPGLWIKMGTSEASTTYEKFIGKTEITNMVSATSGLVNNLSAVTLTGVTMNNSPVSVANHVANLGTVITAETQLSTATTGTGNVVGSIGVSNHKITSTMFSAAPADQLVALSAATTAHTTNTTAHITATERTRWNTAWTSGVSAYTKVEALSAATTAHTANTTMHITATERTRWNNAWTSGVSAYTKVESLSAATTGLSKSVSDLSAGTIALVAASAASVYSSAVSYTNQEIGKLDSTGHSTDANHYITSVTITNGKISAVGEAEIPAESDITTSTTGNGNVITDITATGHALTLAKGITAATSGQVSALSSATVAHINSAASHVSATDRTTWNGKQDAISDLATIRNNALSGASAYTRANSLSAATTAHTANTTVHVTAADKTKWNAAVTGVTSAGTGNAFTEYSIADNILTLTKGATYLTTAATTTQGTRADNALQIVSGSTYIDLSAKSGNAGAKMQTATVKQQGVETASATGQGLADAYDVKQYVEGLVTSSVDYKGATATLPTTSTVGDLYITTAQIALTAAQSATGAAQTAETGDFIIARSSGKWDVVQKNLDGAITGSLTADTVTLGAGEHTVKSLANGSNGQVLSISSNKPAWVNASLTDTATTETGHYTPSTSASTKGTTAATVNFIKGIRLDSKNHVIDVVTGTVVTAQTQLSYDSGTSVSNNASAVMTGLTVSNHAITYGKTNKVFSAGTADSAATLTGNITTGQVTNLTTKIQTTKVNSATTADSATNATNAVSATTSLSANVATNATKVNNHTVNSDVPASALFTDSATTETGHYTPSTSASTKGTTAATANYVKGIRIDSKNHVIDVVTGTVVTAQTQLSTATTGTGNVVCGLTVSNHKITTLMFSAAPADALVALSAATTAHTANTTAHITSTERTRWNNAWTSGVSAYTKVESLSAATTAHTANTTAHITSTERTRWNNAWTSGVSAYTKVEQLSAGTLYELKQTNHNIPYVVQSGNIYTGTTYAYVAEAPEITELVDGQSIIFHPKQCSFSGTTNGSANTCSLSLQLADGTTTTPRPIYLKATAKLTNHLSGCTDVKLTYHDNATYSATTGLCGWWLDFYYDTNSNTLPTQLYGLGPIRAHNAIPRYTLAMQNSAGTWDSIVVNSATSQTSSARTDVGFVLWSDIVYYNATGLTAGKNSATGSTYIAIGSFDFRYVSNCTTSAGTAPLESGYSVYLVGTVGNDGLFYLDETTWWTQNLPTTEDGKVYIYVGQVVSWNAATVALHPVHPVYEYKNGHVRIYQEGSDILGPSYTYSGLPYVNSATTIADAYSALTEEVIESEIIVAAALNDLNDRVLATSGAYVELVDEINDSEKVIAASLNDLNDRVIELSGNVSNIHVDMILGSGYTYSGLPFINSSTSIADACSALTKVVIDDERVTAAGLNDLNDRITSIETAPQILGSGYTYSGLPYVDSATTIADAYSALTSEVLECEFVAAEAFNDLNTRVLSLGDAHSALTNEIIEISGNIDTRRETSIGQSGIEPNVVYNLGTLTGTVSFALVPSVTTDIVNHYYWTFETGTVPPTVTWPSGIIKWAGNCVQNGSPVLVANAHYEVSVMDGYAFIVGV